MKKSLVLIAMAVIAAATIGLGAGSALAQNQQQAPQQQTSAIADDYGIIPQDAVRFRVIANSDNPKDQQLKRDVRDQIIAAVAPLLRGVNDSAKARAILKNSVPQMNTVAEKVIKQEGYSYPAVTDFGMVPFPTKEYGDQVYPAGNYEALRIRIGKAAGQNWWCVLFPPLCFVDMANGDAVAKPKDMPVHKPKAITTVNVMNTTAGVQQKVEVRSALVDWLTELFDAISAKIHSWFA